MITDSITAKGHILIELRNESGELISKNRIKNTITSLGKEHIADRMAAVPAQAPMTNMAIGTGTPSATALGTEVYRKALASRTVSGAVVTYTAHWDIDDQISGSFTEAGIFNATPTGGVMLNSATFATIVKALSDSLDITWTLTFS